ncbi:MAG: S-layer homology domain-containing protein [Thermaerobacter sp.]|nr:S-layer homology domain-containing protein [Thermaerobacter sp.]
MVRINILFASAVSLSLLISCAGVAQADYSYYPPEPSGVTLQVSTPVFSEQIEVGTNTAVTCTLQFQGQTVTMPYDPKQSACVYTWPSALQPGSYQATLSVTAPGYYPLTQTLQFSVAQGAAQSLSPQSLTSLESLRMVNYVRSQEGLSTVAFDPALQAASQAHAQYYVQNSGLYPLSVSVHSEPSSTAPGYTGNQPSDRDSAFGAVGGGNEVMSTNTLTAAWSLLGLYDTTFHRFALLDPTLSALGAGYAASPMTSENSTQAYVSDMTTVFSGTGPLAVEFPWNGEAHVQTAFLGEDPDPLAGIAPGSVTSGGASPESGYPVSVTFDPGKVSGVSVSSATLTGPSGAQVPAYLVDSQDYQDTNTVYGGETMGTSVALFPKAPLAYGTTYTADMQGSLTLKTGAVQPFEEQWSFTTALAPRVAKVFSDGGYLFVVGQNLENAYILSYQWLQGSASIGSPVYAGSHYLAYQVSGDVTQVKVTDGAQSQVLGNYNLSQAPFTDASSSAAFQYAVDGASAAGLVQGFLDHTFRPNAEVTDAQAITMLYRALGSPALPAGTPLPKDAPAFAADAIAWADAQGVILPQDGFQSGASATRAQLATWMLRAYGIPALTTPPNFKDAAQIPQGFAGYVAAAKQDGIVEGYPDGTFRPDSPVSRGAFAIWVLRLAQALQSPQQLF